MMTFHTLAFIGGFGAFGGRGGGGISIFLIFMLIMFVLRMSRGSRGGGRWGGGGGRWGGGYGPYNRPQTPWSQIKPQTPPPPPPPVVPGEEEQATQSPYYGAPNNPNYSEGTSMGAETVRTDSPTNADTRRVDNTTGKPIYSSDDPTAYGEPTRDLSTKPETPRARVTKPYSFDDDDDTTA